MKILTLRSVYILLSLFMLAACGGSGDAIDRTGSDGASNPDKLISVTVVDSAGETDRELSTDNPLTVVATVTDSNGDVVADTLVTFSLSNTDLAIFGNDTATARTDDTGVARIGISVGSLSGDGEITATVSSAETGTTTFSSTGTGSATESPATLELYASAVQLPSSGSDTIELIALVKNSQSVLMEGVTVNFSAPTSAEVEMQVINSETQADGTARASLSTLNNATNRTVTVTAQTGTLVKTVDIEVFGTEIIVNGSGSIIVNDAVELTLRVQDSDGVAIPNQIIALEASSGTLSANSVETGTNGQATVNFTGTVSGDVIITASALNASSEFPIAVQQDEFTLTANTTDDVPLGQDVTVTATWLKDGSAYPTGSVNFSASRGQITAGQESGTTGASGQVSFTMSSDNAGVSSITATGIDADGNQVSARLSIEFIATEPDNIQIDASPDQIGPDGQTSTITAIVRDIEGNLVKGTVVNFNVDDTSTGSISPSEATTDSNGIASTVFTSGSVTSEDAVAVTATVRDTPAVSNQVTLTVGNRAFDVSIGTGNQISEPDNATYLKEFSVFVTDAAGQPVQGVSLTASSTPLRRSKGGRYYKGSWSWNGAVWVTQYSIMVPSGETGCLNEDSLENGILDVGEDTNNDTFLTPGIVGSISFKDTPVTDEYGQATVELRYPQAYGAFYVAEITIFAQSTGSEASESMTYFYGVSADDLSDEAAPPPASPFGVGTSCSDTL